jgi:hypothetical protein
MQQAAFDVWAEIYTDRAQVAYDFMRGLVEANKQATLTAFASG